MIVDVTELGRRVRALRLQRGMTLKQVEALSGLSATHLSEVERGRTSPTIGALTRLACALGRETAYFLEPEELPEVALHRATGEGGFPLAPGISASALGNGIPGATLTCYRVRLDRGATSTFEWPAADTAGDAIYFVETGAVQVQVGDSAVRLEAGDAMQASHQLSHRLSGSGGDAARLLVSSTRPLEVKP